MSGASIRLRLTAWYAGSILVLLLIGTAAARSAIRSALEGEFARAQDAAAALVSGFFRAEVSEYRMLDLTIAHMVSELTIPDRHIHFVRPDGRDFEPPETVRPLVLPPLAPPIREVQHPLDAELAPGWKIRLSTSSAPLERQLELVDEWALLAVPLAVILAIIIGWVLTGRTLRPVAEMADAADRITADSGGRLPIAEPDDELGRMGRRFNAVLDRLDEAMAHQRRFLADAAHELRTPIARARGAGELALSEPAGAGDRDALERTQRELEGMSRLVDDLLALARADSGHAESPLVRGFLDDVVADVVKSFEPMAHRLAVTLEVDMPEEAPVRMEPVTLARMIGILVDNAIRYTPPCGTVSVSVNADPAGVQLEIADTGPGIPEHERARLFERFFRGAEARRIAPQGSGLGLPIASAVAQRHGATIQFSANEPQGTRVTVSFPRV